jgi:hypothetical protein
MSSAAARCVRSTFKYLGCQYDELSCFRDEGFDGRQHFLGHVQRRKGCCSAARFETSTMRIGIRISRRRVPLPRELDFGATSSSHSVGCGSHDGVSSARRNTLRPLNLRLDSPVESTAALRACEVFTVNDVDGGGHRTQSLG